MLVRRGATGLSRSRISAHPQIFKKGGSRRVECLCPLVGTETALITSKPRSFQRLPLPPKWQRRSSIQNFLWKKRDYAGERKNEGTNGCHLANRRLLQGATLVIIVTVQWPLLVEAKKD